MRFRKSIKRTRKYKGGWLYKYPKKPNSNSRKINSNSRKKNSNSRKSKLTRSNLHKKRDRTGEIRPNSGPNRRSIRRSIRRSSE